MTRHVMCQLYGTSLTVRFNETMFGKKDTAPSSPEGCAALAPALADGTIGLLRICASTEKASARTLLVCGMDNVNRETLFDNETHPTLAVFTVNDGHSLDINGTENGEIPLGIYVEKEENIILSFHTNGNFDMNDWQLVDRQTSSFYNLDEEIALTLSESSINRFYLVNRNHTTDIKTLNTEKKAIVTWHDGEVMATAPEAILTRIEVYSYDGMTIATHTLPQAAKRIAVKVNDNHGIVRVTYGNRKTEEYKF